jgi:hypothetical protein
MGPTCGRRRTRPGAGEEKPVGLAPSPSPGGAGLGLVCPEETKQVLLHLHVRRGVEFPSA